MTMAEASSVFQADISQGWNLLWEEGAEREGEHGNFSLILVINPSPYLALQLTVILAEYSQSQ
jgi:hypothetical protein